MVHALRECWRVLQPGGVLLDLRPVTSASPIERIASVGPVRIGAIDGSPGLADDRASEAAMSRVFRERLFRPVSRERFDLHTYWRDEDALIDHLKRPSRRRRVPASGELAGLRLTARRIAGSGFRTRERMQLGVHRRSGDLCA